MGAEDLEIKKIESTPLKVSKIKSGPLEIKKIEEVPLDIKKIEVGVKKTEGPKAMDIARQRVGLAIEKPVIKASIKAIEKPPVKSIEDIRKEVKLRNSKKSNMFDRGISENK